MFLLLVTVVKDTSLNHTTQGFQETFCCSRIFLQVLQLHLSRNQNRHARGLTCRALYIFLTNHVFVICTVCILTCIMLHVEVYSREDYYLQSHNLLMVYVNVNLSSSAINEGFRRMTVTI